MNVSNRVKTAYHKDTVTKYVSLSFPELGKEITGEDIYTESLQLSEKLIDKQSMEFVGCIASMFKISVHGLNCNIKGRKIVVKIWTDGTEDEPVTLFNGIVDSAVSQSNKWNKEITAYDELYTCGNIETAAWYKSLKFPITLKDLRDSLFGFIGLDQVETSLPNDSVTIKKQYAPNTLQALSVIKAICQINGAFGIINREGKFEYRILGKIRSKGAYPGVLLFPGPNTFPGVGAASGVHDLSRTDFAFYRAARYEEFEVRPVDQVTIRQSEDEEGVSFGDGNNKYIIQGNIFTYKLSADVLKKAAENVYNSVYGFSYHPYNSENNGLPFVECGLDVVTYMMINYEATLAESNVSGGIVYEKMSFPVMSRTLTGIQSLKDEYEAKGEEYQTEFITDMQTQIDLLKRKQTPGGVSRNELEDYTYDKDTIDSMFDNFEGGGEGGANIVSVTSIPTSYRQNTVYCVRGTVVIE